MEVENDAPQSMEDVIGQLYDDATSAEASIEDNTPEDTNDDLTGEGEEVETETSSDGEEATNSEESKPQEAIAPPQSMSAKDREAFHALPPEQQRWISERVKQQEADYTKKSMEIADQRKAYERLDQILAPRKQQLAMAGMDESTAIGQLFALSDFADRDPGGFIRYLANQRGLDLNSLLAGGQQQAVDPQFQALQRELESVKGVLHNQQSQAQQVQLQAIEKTISDFSSNPEFPFYAELEADMVPVVQALRLQNPGASPHDLMAKAYKMAMAANGEVSAKAEADRKAKEEADRVAKAKADAAKAKKAKGISSTSSLPAKAAKAKDVDAFIGALVDERMG